MSNPGNDKPKLNLISQSELEILFKLYDAVDGFGPDYDLTPSQMIDRAGVAYPPNRRRLSFLAAHGLVHIETIVHKKHMEDLEARLDANESDRRAGRICYEVYNQRRHSIAAAMDELPEATVYVTGVGASYVRTVRVGIHKKLPSAGLGKNWPFLVDAMKASKEMVLELAGRVLANLIAGR